VRRFGRWLEAATLAVGEFVVSNDSWLVVVAFAFVFWLIIGRGT